MTTFPELSPPGLTRNAVLNWIRVLLFQLVLLFWSGASLACERDPVGRTVILSAFEPERAALQAVLQNPRNVPLNGIPFVTGELDGKPVLVAVTGIGMVNAAMTAQLALDCFATKRIVFSGIAGGVDPELGIGDVVVPDRWSEYLAMVFARSSASGYQLPDFPKTSGLANFGMMFPMPADTSRDGSAPEQRQWFPVDDGLLAIARQVSGKLGLRTCTAMNKCLDRTPRIVVGGNGVSGQSFVDNADFRAYARTIFHAESLDMESAAVAHVAYTNTVPFIAFRSLSDLAGGDATANQMSAFADLAAANSVAVLQAFIRQLP